MNFTISLVTTCRNEIDSVRDWIADIAAQTLRADEIVVVDAESTDGTYQALQEWQINNPRLKLFSFKSRPAAGRNKAIEEAYGDIIASTDMGCRLEPDWLEKLVKPFSLDNSIEMVAGNYRVDQKSLHSIAALADFIVNDEYLCNPCVPSFLPSNRSVAYKKTIWRLLGKYPEDLKFAGDDYVFAVLAKRNQIKMACAPQAICYWTRHTRSSDFWREKRVYGYAIGEADLLKTRLLKIDNYFLYWLSVVAYSLILTTKALLGYSTKSIRHHKFFLLPALGLLMLGNFINYYLGYREGFKQGSITAFDCRSRLKK